MIEDGDPGLVGANGDPVLVSNGAVADVHGLDVDVEQSVVLEGGFLMGFREGVGGLRDDEGRVFLVNLF